MRKTLIAAVTTAAALSSAVPAAAVAPADADMPAAAFAAPKHDGPLTVVGLSPNGKRLLEFKANKPGKAWELGRIRGLWGDSRLVGIDFRVQDHKLYGVGNRGGIYTLNPRATAQKVSQLTVDLEGRRFGVDFNPAADRLRVISNTGQNLRHNIDDPSAPEATIEDGTLTNPTMPPSTARGVTGAAYTNNDLDPATATTLFDIDTRNDRVSLQSPANAGTLAAVGALGVNVGPSAGFDIYYCPKKGTNSGFAALRVNGSYRFYKVNVLTGEAHKVGAFPERHQIADVALPLNQH
ncbi:DUF4394 domain-containing protein [Streptomyces hazeniae]